MNITVAKSRYYVRPQNNRYFEKSELRLIVGDDIKISVGEKNMLVLEDYNQKIKNKIVIQTKSTFIYY